MVVPAFRLADMIQGDGRTLHMVLTRDSEDSNSWIGSAIRLLMGIQSASGITPLITLSRVRNDLDIIEETASGITFEAVIPSGATSSLTVPKRGLDVLLDVEVTPVGGQPFTQQARWTLFPQVPSVEYLDVPSLVSINQFGSHSVAA